MKKILLLVMMCLFSTFYMMSATDIVYMNVGDTRTLSFNAPSYIVGTQWTISDYDAIEFVTYPASTSVRATIKALSSRSAANRVIVHCTYYYRELDPTTGRYEYQRTGYQDWEVIIRESGSGGDSSGPTVSMHYHDCSLTEGEQLVLAGYVSDDSYAGNYKWSSSNSDVLTITDTRGPTVWTKAKSQGSSNLRVTLDNGNYDEINVTVYPRYELDFTLTSDGNGYAVSAKDKSAKGEIAIPSFYNGKPVTEINGAGFWDCNYITSVIIPSTVTTIGSSAFMYCSNLKTIVIPNSVITIGSSAFEFSGLKSVKIPNSVSHIGKWAFGSCQELETVNIENASMDISEYLFQYCKKLKSVNLGNSITSVKSGAFSYCESLTDVILPESVTEIESHAFSYCSNLKTIVIPKGVSSLGHPTGFGTCASLMGIFVDPENTRCNSVDGVLYNKNLTSLESYPGGKSGAFIVPSNIKTLSPGAFYGCKKLTSISIHNNVKSIGGYAFWGCSQLLKIIDSNPSPQSLSNKSFGDSEMNGWVPLSASIYIPNGSLNAYKEAPEWSRFSNFHEMGTVDIKFNVANVNLNIGESFQAEIDTILDPDVVIKSVSWITPNPDIVSIDNDGKIIALSKGKTRIYFTIETQIGAVYTNSYGVSVTATPEVEIILSHSDIEMKIGESVEISAEVLPEKADQTVMWFSSDDEIAYVDTSDSKPKIIAIAEGSCEIYAYPANYPDCRATCKVTVNNDNMGGNNLLVYDVEEEPVFFNLQGGKVGNDISVLPPGIYIKCQGSKIEKILVK